MPDAKDEKDVFRPRSRLLQLLGDQLIGSAKLAVFELVKNAYDADASTVTVTLTGLGTSDSKIEVVDDGQGMSLDVVRNVWLVPGDDFREKQRWAEIRSPKFHRLPLGEKGVGRFAVHKLGDRIQLVTRAAGEPECVVDIDWTRLLRSKFLDDAQVSVKTRPPKCFKGEATGTAVTISELRDIAWTRREVRDLYRQITSIVSPFTQYQNEFSVELKVPEHPRWISTLPDTEQLLRQAPWKFDFQFDGTKFGYTYDFRGVSGIRVPSRKVNREDIPLLIPGVLEPDELDPAEEAPRRRKPEKVSADASTVAGIGPIAGTFYVYDRDRIVLSKISNSRFVERFLDSNGGVRVYRDGVRVYNYGEVGDDWLGLDLRRVNSPTRNISRNIIVGAIDLSLQGSQGLKEKTNREGFVENAAFSRLQRLVLGALAAFEAERRIDKTLIRVATGGTEQPSRDLSNPIAQLRSIAAKHQLSAEMGPVLNRIEHDYAELRDNFLRAGLSQVGVAVVFHELERGIGVLYKAIAAGQPLQELKLQAGQLQEVLENSSQLLRKSERGEQSLRQVVRRARDITSVRFRLHRVKFECPALEHEKPDPRSSFVFNLVLGALTNMIDNAIHWLDISHPEDAHPVRQKRLYVNIVPDFPSGPAIVVADNGLGFLDAPEIVVQPFFSRRPDGMGLGLYYANMVMQLNDGQLAFPSREEAGVPESFTGAVVALVFKESPSNVHA